MPVQIPEQLFYKIGQVSQITGVQAYVLRYWESEFGLLKPRKDKRGQRLYRRKDIELILRIKELLHEQGFSIRGAKQKLKKELAQNPETKKYTNPELRVIIDRHKTQIRELMDLLEHSED